MSMFKNYFKTLIDKIYKVNDVQQGYFFWLAKLLDICMDLFKYNGLPKSIPEEEIEKRLLTTGYCAFLQHPTLGLIVCDSYPYNYDLYGRFEYVNFFNPYKKFNIPGITTITKKIGVECAIIYNNSIEKYLNKPIQGSDIVFQEICRYARQLADLESSINLYIRNSRQPYLITAADAQTEQSILQVFRSMARGEQKAILDKNILKDATSIKQYDIINGFLTELLDARNSIVKQFLADFGIFSTDDKKERLIVDEMAQENRNVKCFVYSMLKERQNGLEMVNNLYGTNITVELRAELFDHTELYDETEEVIEEKTEDNTEEVKEGVNNED